MTIYATPYDPDTLLCTGPSEPAGFESLADVTLVMGEPRHPGRRVHSYPELGLAFSDFRLQGVPTDDAT